MNRLLRDESTYLAVTERLSSEEEQLSSELESLDNKMKCEIFQVNTVYTERNCANVRVRCNYLKRSTLTLT